MRKRWHETQGIREGGGVVNNGGTANSESKDQMATRVARHQQVDYDIISVEMEFVAGVLAVQ